MVKISCIPQKLSENGIHTWLEYAYGSISHLFIHNFCFLQDEFISNCNHTSKLYSMTVYCYSGIL